MLNWRTITSSRDPQFWVSGTPLSVALFGPNKRFAVYETRVYIRAGEYDREYLVRDAEQISDADLASGKKPPIVGRTKDYDALMIFADKWSSRARE